MSSELIKGIVYILAFLISDILGYKLTSLTTTPEIINKKNNTSSIEIVTSSIDSNGEIKIEIKTVSSTIIATSSLKNLPFLTSSTSSESFFNISSTKEK